MPVIGFLGSLGPGPSAPLVAAFREGLSEIGFEDGQSVAIEYRWGEGRFDQQPKSSLSMLSTTSVASGRTFAAEAVRLPAPCPRAGGTDSSDPASSSGESTANLPCTALSTGILAILAAIEPDGDGKDRGFPAAPFREGGLLLLLGRARHR
jgi:hypothetical protein